MNIEVEIRTFITKEKYEELLDFFKKEGSFINEDEQETYYFDSEEDLRIQKNKFFSKIWMKKGKIHDEQREEIEVKCKKEDFENLEKIFLAAKLNISIKWLRKRINFKWQEIDVAVDYTKGYGYILELEKIANEENKEEILKELKEKLALLNIKQTPKEEFDKKYQEYRKNWKELITQ